MNIRNRSRTRRRGFTLIELMVVVLILAVLAALVVPRIVNSGETAKVGAAKADLSQIKSLLDQFKLQNGRYPSSEEGLAVLSSRTAPSGLEGTFQTLSSKDIINDPWGHPYQYDLQSSTEYTVLSYGADGVEGGTGNDSDLSEHD